MLVIIPIFLCCVFAILGIVESRFSTRLAWLCASLVALNWEIAQLRLSGWLW